MFSRWLFKALVSESTAFLLSLVSISDKDDWILFQDQSRTQLWGTTVLCTVYSVLVSIGRQDMKAWCFHKRSHSVWSMAKRRYIWRHMETKEVNETEASFGFFVNPIQTAYGLHVLWHVDSVMPWFGLDLASVWVVLDLNTDIHIRKQLIAHEIMWN